MLQCCEAPMLKYICKRLKVGYVNVGDHFASYSVASKNAKNLCYI
jgi:hypothetical protein